MDKRFDPELPVVLGLGGGSGAGKTVTANGFAPAGRVARAWYEEPTISWDHLYYALPLYRMATVRQTVEGDMAYDRMAYEILQVLLEVFGTSPLYGAPDFNDLVQFAYEITEFPCPREGKPRAFLQQVGTEMMRGHDEDVWIKWMDRKIKKDFQSFTAEQEAAENRRELLETPSPNCTCDPSEPNNRYDFQPYYGVVISDCRFKNELQYVRDHPNGVLIKLTASPGVIEERQIKRDGFAMETTHKAHSSETELTSVPDDWYDDIINTDNLSIKDQIVHVQQIVTNFTGAVHA